MRKAWVEMWFARRKRMKQKQKQKQKQKKKKKKKKTHRMLNEGSMEIGQDDRLQKQEILPLLVFTGQAFYEDSVKKLKIARADTVII